MMRGKTNNLALWMTSLFLCLDLGAATLRADPEGLPQTPDSTGEIAVSLDVKDADVRDVLRALARQANVNMAVTETVKGKITIRIEEAPWTEALDAVIQTAGLAAKRKGNLLTVMVPAEIQEHGLGVPELETRALTFKFTDAKAVQDAFKAQISAKGSVSVDEDANSLIISDIPQNIEKLTTLAASIDVAPRQVMIEAVIADTTLRDDTDIGVNWEIARTTGHSVFSLGQDLIATTGGGGTATYQILTGKWTTDDFVRALKEVGNTRILASPRILVLSARTASISTVEEIPYQELTETSAGGQIGTTAFKEAGVKLSVTPRITEDGRILLTVSVEQSATTGESVNGVPVINSRKAETAFSLTMAKLC